MKDAAKLLAYFIATVLFGAILAPLLFWGAQWLNNDGYFGFLARYDFETFFHRALLVGALLFSWPLLRALRLRDRNELGFGKNGHAWQHAAIGFLAAAIPLLCLGALLLTLGVYSLRSSVSPAAIGGRTLSALVVPLIEEPLFRGLILGVLLRRAGPALATFLTSAFFSILHFLKAPENTSLSVTWNAGFVSIANAFSQFRDPLLVTAGFTTLFLLGWILADARIRTRSLWLPIGLHSGWIFASALFNKIAHRELVALPWLGKSLLIGLVPLGVALITWAVVRVWLRNVQTPQS